MILRVMTPTVVGKSIPRESGDDPLHHHPEVLTALYSPRERG